MAEGYYLVQGDKTTCGGKIITGAEDHSLFDRPVAREQDGVTCGQYPGLFRIAGGIDNDTIHGRRMAGTLDSLSTCPCRAKFVPSMLQDTYEKMSGMASADNLIAGVATGTTAVQKKPAKSVGTCDHENGAKRVAEYICQEIRTNVRSETAHEIRSLIKKLIEWNKSGKLDGPKYLGLAKVMFIWYQKVKTGADWDHKPTIRDRFDLFAVARPLPSGTPSRSYYHKYREYDYFYDVWSNIHYGYVGRSVGFSKKLLLKGSGGEQQMTPGAQGDDPLDDVTSMEIGFKLFDKYGRYADTLMPWHILEALDNTPVSQLPVSKQVHWCRNENNPNMIK